MKAYLVKESKPLFPFEKPASEMLLGSLSIRQQLIHQLEGAGLQVELLDFFDVEAFKKNTHSPVIEPTSIVLFDNLVLSSNFIEYFLTSIPLVHNNYQCVIDTQCFALFNTNHAASLRQLPLYYFGKTAGEIDTIEISPPVVRKVKHGLPMRMAKVDDVSIYFLGVYALDIIYWFDLLTASSLFCRKQTTAMMKRADSLGFTALLNYLIGFGWIRQWFTRRSNQIGRNCRIHPSAVIEGCTIGDNVDIGPFVCLRASVILDHAVIREHCIINFSYIGKGAYIMGANVFNSYVGAEVSIVTPMLYNCVMGDRSFVSGGSGFADFSMASSQIMAHIEGVDVPSGLSFLGSCVGEDSFIGADLIFIPGRTIANKTSLMTNSLIKHVPSEGGAYVFSSGQFIKIPSYFL
jgi:carbonic anhydrase/acetyltransferase-like protein (isoleucine patch superfamily)